MISRRSLFSGFAALLATPAVAKAASMIPPAKPKTITLEEFARRIALRYFPRERNLTLVGVEFDYPTKKIWFDDGAKISSELRIRLPSDYRLT